MMTHTEKQRNRFEYGDSVFLFDKLSFSCGTQVLSTATLENGIFRNIQGKKPFEILIDGSFAPDDQSFFTQLINTLSGKSVEIKVNSSVFSGAVLKSSVVEIQSKQFTGKVSLEFEVI